MIKLFSRKRLDLTFIKLLAFLIILLLLLLLLLLLCIVM